MKLLPSLKQLEYLVALDAALHFGHAAEHCNITPSTLSAGIRDLENVLGVPLAERTKRSVVMTPIGAEIAARSRLLLRDAEEVMALAASNHEPMSGDLRLGVIPTISPFLLPRVMPAINARHPALRLYLREEQTAPLLSRLRSGEIDLALIALPYDIEGLTSRVIFEDKFQLACNKSHRLAKKKTVAVSALTDEPLMLLEEGHCLRGHALEACQFHDVQVRAQFEATSLHTLVQMVAAGMGVTLLPELAIDSQITRGTLIKLVPLSNNASRQIGLVWRKSSPRSQDFETLGQTLKSLVVGKQPGS
jgi:LysR family hydrogen peroxide-inducible transcriptional activator